VGKRGKQSPARGDPRIGGGRVRKKEGENQSDYRHRRQTGFWPEMISPKPPRIRESQHVLILAKHRQKKELLRGPGDSPMIRRDGSYLDDALNPGEAKKGFAICLRSRGGH